MGNSSLGWRQYRPGSDRGQRARSQFVIECAPQDGREAIVRL
jgi:hypothetical protein